MTKSKETERKEWEYLPVYRRDENSFELSIEINSPRARVPGWRRKKYSFKVFQERHDGATNDTEGGR